MAGSRILFFLGGSYILVCEPTQKQIYSSALEMHLLLVVYMLRHKDKLGNHLTLGILVSVEASYNLLHLIYRRSYNETADPQTNM